MLDPLPLRRPRLRDAAPFWVSLALVPVVGVAAGLGGWWLLLIPASTWGLFTALDTLMGEDRSNLSVETPDAALFWHRAITLVWPFVQTVVLVMTLWWLPTSGLGVTEMLGLFFGLGVIAGTIGIVYSHELMHRKTRGERLLADLLLAQVFYGHFRSEHLLVHHRYVGTPRDPVSARRGEGFWGFFLRVLPSCYVSAARAEADLLTRRGLRRWHWSHPFWRYHLWQVFVLLAAYALAGWPGVGLTLFHGFVGIWQLELVNYVEHYGLSRRHLGGGRYERTGHHHSWNATHRASNWLLINLQRHSDHHMSPSRPYPLLQSGDRTNGPELPYGYPVMTALALVPPAWRWRMDPRVDRWRQRHYPDISDWTDYDEGRLPTPR